MDDMKRAIYMLALEKIGKSEEKWVCVALCRAIEGITGAPTVTFEDANKLLPEFHSLYDGKHWYKYGNSIQFYRPLGGRAWWKFGWKEPRVRILNYILCHH